MNGDLMNGDFKNIKEEAGEIIVKTILCLHLFII
jgi:hypothetical protein